MSKKSFAYFLLIITALLISLLLLIDGWPFLRGGFGWRWPYVGPAWNTVSSLFLPALLSLIYLLGVWQLREKSAWLFLGWVLLGTALIPPAFLRILEQPLYLLYVRTVSSLISGGYTAGTEISSLAVTLPAWPQLMTDGQIGQSIHTTLSPPGWPTVYYLAAKAWAMLPGLSAKVGMALRPFQCHNPFVMAHTNAQISSAWLGILSPLWGALTILPLYGLSRQLTSERVARFAAAGWVLVPALTLFMATLNTPYPLFAAAVFFFLVSGLKQSRSRGQFVYLMLAGVFSAVCLVFNFSFLPVILFCGWFTLLFLWAGSSWPASIAAALKAGLQFGLGLALILLLYWLATGHHLLALIPIAMGRHLDLERPYLPWLWLHTWDVVLFVGLPIFGLWLFSLGSVSGKLIRRMSLALLLTLAIMVLSGTARGETGRVWMFFMPFMLLAAADVWQKQKIPWQIGLLAAQIVWLFTLILVLRPVGLDLERPPLYAELAPSPLETAVIPVQATFGDELLLENFQSAYSSATNQLTLHLTWQPLQQMAAGYFFSVAAVAPDGSVQVGEKWSPLDYQYPTTCWLPGETAVVDSIIIDLGPQPQSGDWWLSLSAFSLAADDSPHYLPVTLPDGSIDPSHQIGLGPQSVP